MHKVLILVPHGDDEVLGFGGTISKHVRNKDSVYVAFLRSSYDERTKTQEQNIEEAASILGYNNFYKLNLFSKNYNNYFVDNLSKLESFISSINPDILYIPHINDVHQDHYTTVNFSKIATRIHGSSKIPIILSGEIISSSGNCFDTQKKFNPNYYIKIEEEDLLKKQMALECYKKEIKKYPHPRSIEGIKIYAQMRGFECGCIYAEAFECLRFISL